MTPAMQLAKLLTEIVVQLFLCDHLNPVPDIKSKKHIDARFVFDAIRICRDSYDEEDALFLRYYKMAVLIELLPLAALYNCNAVLGPKIGLFLAELSAQKARSDFDFSEWLDISMLEVYRNAPEVFKSDDDIEYRFPASRPY